MNFETRKNNLYPIFFLSSFSNLNGNLDPILQLGNNTVFLVGTQNPLFSLQTSNSMGVEGKQIKKKCIFRF